MPPLMLPIPLAFDVAFDAAGRATFDVAFDAAEQSCFVKQPSGQTKNQNPFIRVCLMPCAGNKNLGVA